MVKIYVKNICGSYIMLCRKLTQAKFYFDPTNEALIDNKHARSQSKQHKYTRHYK